VEIGNSEEHSRREGGVWNRPLLYAISNRSFFTVMPNIIERDVKGLNKIELLEEFLFPDASEKTVDPPDDMEYCSFGKFSAATEDSYGEETVP